VTFRLRIEADPDDPAIAACELVVVCFGEGVAPPGLEVGSAVEVEGSITERRWKGPGGIRKGRYEVLARTIRVR
jgi:hypothetical protein